MATRSTSQTTGQGLQSDALNSIKNPYTTGKLEMDALSSRVPQRANLLSKAEYDAMPNDYKTTIDGKKYVMVMGANGGTTLAPWLERDARIPKGKSAWYIGRDEARGYGMDDEALQNAQRLETQSQGRNTGALTEINLSSADQGFAGFKIRYPDAYGQSYDSWLTDSSKNSKGVKQAAIEALELLYRKSTEAMTSSEIQIAVDTYVKQKLGDKAKPVRWNMKSYPD